ncbi:MAG: DUF2892 domain-containing protein [Nitrospiraceae bacterium]
MACNVGGIERPIRIGLGAVLILVAVMGEFPPLGMWALVIGGGIALVSGLMGFCPAWALLGINTCPAPIGKKS